MTEIRVPTLGESVTEATIGRRFTKPGDAVAADEPLCELETDKVTLEVNAPASGTLAEIIAKDGETARCWARSPMALALWETHACARVRQARRGRHAFKFRRRRVLFTAQHVAVACGSEDRRRSGFDTQRHRRLRQAWSGAKGDVLAFLAQPASAPASPPPAAASPTQLPVPSAGTDAPREERVGMTKLRQTIARRLKDVQNTAAMLTRAGSENLDSTISGFSA